MKLATVLYLVVTLILISIYIFYKMDKTSLPDISLPRKEASFPQGYTVGAWEWKSPYDMDEAEIKDFLNNASSSGINAVYIDVSKYIDIREEKNASAAEEQLKTFEGKLRLFLKVAAEKNIKVEALGGNSNWADREHNYVPQVILQYIHDFNKRNENKFAGVHFDIESWNAKDFNKDKMKHLMDFLTTADVLVNQNINFNKENNTNIYLAFDIAYWLDNENGNIPEMYWKGRRTYPLFHLIHALDQEKGNYIVVMAYRNFAQGKDGSIKHSKEELDYIRDNNLGVNVLIGQEVSPSDISKITFDGKSKEEVKGAANEIVNYYKDFPQFKGVALHKLSTYIRLNEW